MGAITIRKRVRVLAVKLRIIRPLRRLMSRVSGAGLRETELSFHRRVLRPGQLVFDVGANRGQSAEIYLALGARVVAFEPQTSLHPEIHQMCRHDPRLTVEAVGLGALVESRQLYLASYDQVASLRREWEGQRVGTRAIQMSTLDEQIARHGAPSFCKIDVEGWEVQVLDGLGQALPLISFEYHCSKHELPHAIAALRRVASLGDYVCNVREAGASEFLLAVPLSIGAFADAFPDRLGRSLTQPYGDLFCALDAAVLSS
jgi:FkbM family methyltransferase